MDKFTNFPQKPSELEAYLKRQIRELKIFFTTIIIFFLNNCANNPEFLQSVVEYLFLSGLFGIAMYTAMNILNYLLEERK